MPENLNIVTLIIACMLLSCESRNTNTLKCRNREKTRMEGKIVDGRFVSITEFPYTAVLKIGCGEKDPSEKHLKTETRTGTILNQYFVITEGMALKLCKHHFGFIGIGVGTENEMNINHLAESFNVHSGYNKISNEHNIALIKSSTPFTFSDRVKRAIVMRHPPTFKIAHISGWGTYGHDETYPRHQFLKAASVQLNSTEECNRWEKNKNKLTSFCVFGPVLEDDTCEEHMKGFPGAYSYESGVGIVVNKSILMGVYASASRMIYENETVLGRTIVVANVSCYYDWIIKTMASMFCESK